MWFPFLGSGGVKGTMIIRVSLVVVRLEGVQERAVNIALQTFVSRI